MSGSRATPRARFSWAVFSAAVLSAGAGCQPVIDTSGLEPLTGYDTWYRVDVSGPLFGHGESYRSIFVNDVARGYGHVGRYPVGSVIVKEIRELEGADQPGALRYLGVMRKLGDGTLPGVDLEGDWLFTMMDELGDDEVQGASCFSRCHRQAPIDSAWLDYGM